MAEAIAERNGHGRKTKTPRETGARGSEVPLNIAGVLGEATDGLALASVNYYRIQQRFSQLTIDCGAPVSREEYQDSRDLNQIFEHKERLARLEESFRFALRNTACMLDHTRDLMIDFLAAKKDTHDSESWKAILDLFAQWAKCAERLQGHFPDIYVSPLPSAHEVIEIVGECQTLNALVQAFCEE
jgi:hypothetical protein